MTSGPDGEPGRGTPTSSARWREVPKRVAKDGDRLLAEEPQLIREAQAGDRAAFAVLIDRYWDRLYRWLYHLTRDGHAAEDLAQETFLKAFAAVNRFKAGTNFRAWLFRIGHNNFVNLHRSRASQRQPLPAEAISRHEGPVELALDREGMELLAKAITRLPVEFRSAFLLRVEEGMSFRQLSSILGVTEETARWRVFKARQKLLQALSPDLLPPVGLRGQESEVGVKGQGSEVIEDMDEGAEQEVSKDSVEDSPPPKRHP